MASSAASPPRAVMPTYMIYGTAWKKERTAELVYQAIKAGFRAIDTAHIKKHYDEAGAGEGIRRAVAEGLVKRTDLWIQTKFTLGDDAFADTARYPTLTSQVDASIAESLRNLCTPDREPAYIDCLILHSPLPSLVDFVEVWFAMVSHYKSGAVRTLGVSNVDLKDLVSQFSGAFRVAVVQNRFSRGLDKEHRWDEAVRSWCHDQGVAYQGFWTLTANSDVWGNGGATDPEQCVAALAERAKISPATAWYVLLFKMGVVVLNGTSSEEHMRDDLAGLDTVKTSVPPSIMQEFVADCSKLTHTSWR
ncbi:putative aldo-keto reductase [Podospora appendiculata]|uniref:Aldo-keto reductase n=1 Tax=Podospora appendiculata TaxID=314037 RepID=A0AAE0X2M8_9PEZI|nr:putative aldo-keto reductase [Podospora appendiculata]